MRSSFMEYIASNLSKPTEYHKKQVKLFYAIT